MSVAHDAAFESHTGTSGSANQASFSWTHTPVGTPRGVTVFVFNLDSSSADATGVTYGGVNVPAVPGAVAADTATEAGRCTVFHLGSGIPTGAQTVVVNRNNNAHVMYAVSITQTATKDTYVPPGSIVLLQEDGTLAAQSVDDGSPGSNSVRYAGGMSGLASVPAVATGSTALQSLDIGQQVAATCRETTAGQGARTVGFSSATSDDRAFVHLAVSELPTAPTVTTQAASSIAEETATGNGNITAIGGATPDERGIVYSTSTHGAPGNVAPGSSGYESVSNETGSFSTGAFTRSLTSLAPNTTYFARAYAHNAGGYTYGAEVSFTTLNWAIRLSPSANIASGGTTATTAQLAAPAGKTTSAFTAGKISDDTNPPPAIDIAANGYTELEWCLQATAGVAVNADQYEFRVTIAGTPLDSYTATPTWTIGSGASVVGATISSTVLFAPTLAQTITGTTISATVVRAPSVALAITTGTVTSGNQVFAPTVALAVSGATISATVVRAPTIYQNVTGGTVVSGNQVFAPSAQPVIAGSTVAATQIFAPSVIQNVTGAFVSSTVVRAPTVALTVSTGTVTATQVFAPSIVQNVTGGTVANTQVFAPSTAYAVTGGTVSNTTLFAPTVTFPGAEVIGGTITSSNVLFAPSVELNISTGTVSATAIFAPTVALTITTGTVAPGTQVFAPTIALAVTGGTVAATQLFAPSLAYVVSLSTIAATAIYAPTLSAEGVVTGGTVGPTVVLFAPTLTLNITTSTVSTTQVFAPSALPVQEVSGGTVPSTLQLFAPSLSLELGTGTVFETALFAPVVTYTVVGGTIVQSSQVYAPSTSPELFGATIDETAVFPPSLALEIASGFVNDTVLYAPSVTGGLPPVINIAPERLIRIKAEHRVMVMTNEFRIVSIKNEGRMIDVEDEHRILNILPDGRIAPIGD